MACQVHTCDLDLPNSNAFRMLVERNASPKYLPLRADRVDLPAQCSLVNPEPFLPTEVAYVIQHPDALFPSGVEHERTEPSFSAGARAEYVMLLRRQVRVHKVQLARSIQHVASVFAVGKSDKNRQREVWDGGPLCSCTLPPPEAPHLANPSALSTLESSDDRPLWVSTRDGASFFDQLYLTPELREYTGRPAVTVNELCNAAFRGAGDCNQHPLTADELAAACVDTGLAKFTSETVLYPRATCWPMGHSWSSAIAQFTMVGACKQAGVADGQFLSD